ncbi:MULTISPECIES: hypothetical protein [Paracoccus]|nr:hypothetical protein [Paracoccus onubensis]MDP0928753.1 hypothetical protein [Paracoccus onubensis]
MRAVMMAVLACGILAGCNTVAGVGEDITGVAHWGQSFLGGGY